MSATRRPSRTLLADLGRLAHQSSICAFCPSGFRLVLGNESGRSGELWVSGENPDLAGTALHRGKSVLEQAVVQSKADQLGTSAKPQFLTDVRPVCLDRFFADVQLIRDLRRGIPVSDESENFALSFGYYG